MELFIKLTLNEFGESNFQNILFMQSVSKEGIIKNIYFTFFIYEFGNNQ